MTKEEKKKIQRDRVKGYFLNASIDIIKEEGLENLTTKKIGDKAGYSYATIYNYFENFNELICLSMIKIAEECATYITGNLTGANIVETCCNFSDLMVEFNAENPNIYYPFLSTSVDFSYFENESEKHFIHPAYNILLDKIGHSNEFQKYKREDIITLMDIFTALFHSALHFYILLNSPKSLEELKGDLRRQLIFLLNNYI